MNIKFIANIRIPTEKAHGYQICKMCEEFADAGADVELIVPRRKNNYSDDIFEFYKLKKNFNITKVFCLDLVSFRFWGFWVERLSFSMAAKIYLYKNNDNIIFARDEFVGLFFKKYFLELHDLSMKMYSWRKSFFKNASKIFVLTKGLKKDLVNLYNISDSKILVSPDGVDLQKFNDNVSQEEARKKLGLSQTAKLIMYTGHLYGWKGTDTLAKAAKFFDENTEFIFVGGTENDLVMFREKYSGFKNIKILGQKSHSEIPFYLASADVLVLPNSGHKNISRFYTSPLKLFEYMASGRPIVASDLPSIREILNEENAVFFEPDNSESLAEAIKKVLSDNELGNKISQQALNDVQDYSWKKRAERIAREMKKYNTSLICHLERSGAKSKDL